jgi:hypothetical protein
VNERMTEEKLTIFVSSSVHGNMYLLDQIFSTLKGYGYTVWMSHKGTLPHDSRLSPLDNCLVGVQNCDLFLGIITPFYGSGKEGTSPSVTHLELRKAIEIDKLRWILAHEQVKFARSFLKNLDYDTPDKRRTLSLKKTPIFEDLQIIDMYEEAVSNQQPFSKRRWVQTFRTTDDVLLYIDAQLSDYYKIKKILQENSLDALRDSPIDEKRGDLL